MSTSVPRQVAIYLLYSPCDVECVDSISHEIGTWFCCALFCCACIINLWWINLIYLPISFRVASLALGQSYSASAATLKGMGKVDQYQITMKCNNTWSLCIILGMYVCHNHVFRSPQISDVITYKWPDHWFLAPNASYHHCWLLGKMRPPMAFVDLGGSGFRNKAIGTETKRSWHIIFWVVEQLWPPSVSSLT